MGETTHDWLLIFDADERCTPKLRREIEELIARSPKYEAFGTYVKWSFLWSWRVNAARGMEPELPRSTRTTRSGKGWRSLKTTPGPSEQGT